MADLNEGRHDTPRSRARFIAFGVAAAVLFSALGGRLFQLQVVNGDQYAAEAAATRTIEVALRSPRGLVFDRQETSGCSEEVVFGDFGIRRFLPAHRRTAVEVTPAEPGTYEFTCGMGMLRGRLVAD